MLTPQDFVLYIYKVACRHTSSVTHLACQACLASGATLTLKTRKNNTCSAGYLVRIEANILNSITPFSFLVESIASLQGVYLQEV